MITGRLQQLLAATIFLSVVLSCESNNPAPVNDYFPLMEGFTWKYKVVTDCACNCPCAGFEDMFSGSLGYEYSNEVKGDTVLNGKSYKQIRFRDGSSFKFVRREGDAYYERGYYGDEFKILDTSIPVGGTWTEKTDLFWETINTIKSVKKSFKTGSKVYRNVIEVEQAVYYKDASVSGDCSRNVLFHYYAPDLGEVYTYRPYNRCTYYSGDTHNYLVSAGH